MEYLNKVLGIKVTYEDVEFKHLPNFIVMRYRLQMASMNGKKAIFLYPKTELEQIGVLKKHVAWIQKNENLPVVLVLKEIISRQKEYLLREKIPFVVEGRQIYLPFMALYLQEWCNAEREQREEMRPSAQMLLLHFIYGGAQELSTSQAAKDLELTPTSISRASKQLEEMGLLHIKKEGVPQFYRFSHPITNQYPAMIELFTRKLDAIQLPEDAVLTPLPIDEDISSLSAILLDDDYYEFLKQGKVTVDGVTVLDAAYLIPFKAKAWMDLIDRKAAGEHVDSKNIKKHKNDVFRLTELIDPMVKITAPQGVYADIQDFIQKMQNESIDIKQLGLVGRMKDQVLDELKDLYIAQ